MALTKFNVTLAQQNNSLLDVKIASDDNNLAATSLENDQNLVTIPMTDEVIVNKGYSPFVGPNGTWFEYDNKKHIFYDTQIVARGDSAIHFRNRFEFPSIGEENMLYVAKDENLTYIFNATTLTYEKLGSPDYHEIDIIQGTL